MIEYGHFVGGKAVAGKSGRSQEVFQPMDGTVRGSVALASKAEVYDLIEKEVRKVNATLVGSQRIRKFALLYKELDADDDELTRTRKVRRAFVDQKYAGIIEGIYEGKPQIPIDAVIKYQDGKTSQLKTTIHVRDLGLPDEARPAVT